MDLNMQAIKARRAAITPGKWEQREGDPRTENEVCVVRGLPVFGDYAAVSCRDDAAFIVNAPADIDALVKRVEDLEAERVAAKAKLDHYTDEVLTIGVEQEDRITELEAALNAYAHKTKPGLWYKGEFYKPGEWPGKPEGYPDGAAS